MAIQYDFDDDDDTTIAAATLLTGKLDKQMLANAEHLTRQQIRGLVDTYYQVQDYRKAAANQQRAVDQGVDSNPLIHYVIGQMKGVEQDIKRMMDAATDAHMVTRWCKQVFGIGPTLAAGLYAHVDIHRTPTASALWRFAGQDPTQKWLGAEAANALVKEYLGGTHDIVFDESLAALAVRLNRRVDDLMRIGCGVKAGEECDPATFSTKTLAKTLARRPWNASLKVLCWKISTSFQKVATIKGALNPKASIYSYLYLARKDVYRMRNDAGQYRERAGEMLATHRYGMGTAAYASYSKGRLPDGHIDAMARRYAVKVFLANFWTVYYESTFKRAAPKPYIIDRDPRHTHYIAPPGWSLD